MAKKIPPKKPVNPPKPDGDEEDTGADEGGESDGDDSEEDNDRKINAIVTNRVNRALKPLSKLIEGLNAKIDSMSKPKEGDDSDDPDDEEDTEPQRPTKRGSKPNKQLTALEKRVRDAEERAQNAEKAQKDQAEKALRQEEDSAITAALQKAGITDPRVAKAITLSLRADELIVRDDETNKVRFKSVDKHGYEDLVDPDTGLGKWLKSDGKAFMPAVAAGGSGAGGTASQQVGRANMSKQEIGKLSPREKAAIDLERASRGEPPLES